MTEIIVQFEVDDRPMTVDEITDEYLAEMLEHTSAQIQRQVERQVGDLTCEEHGGRPRVTVTGMYSTEADQMELNYHVDTCCQMLLMRTVQALNH
ncbi:MAG: hypothetical protein GC179_26645 [Anaerolineaceae bacterium]|nr:hypothetical protein [Anaerolineaceae bacterium]